MPLRLVPLIYVAASLLCGVTLPPLEHNYFPTAHAMSVASAQAFLSAVTTGMLALTGVVVAFALVIVQFSSTAYSPRLMRWIGSDPVLFNAFGMFIATFLFALSTLAFTDRNGDGTVPFYSITLVEILLVASMILLSQLIQRLGSLQITRVLRFVGDLGRKTISQTHPRDDSTAQGVEQMPQLGNPAQTLRYYGEPRAIVKLDIEAIVALAQRADALIVLECTVGDALVDDTILLRTYGTNAQITEKSLMRTIHLGGERTFEQDPRYAFRLLVDVAIRALSPAVNDPTTAVQSLDQIEDLLSRIGRRHLESGYVRDAQGKLRVILPMPTWRDYVMLAFDEIRLYGSGSIQVLRRLRCALCNLIECVKDPERVAVLRNYLQHLDASVEVSSFDREDRVTARQEDRQGIGVSRSLPH